MDEYAVPTVPEGSDAVEIVSALTLIVNAFCAVSAGLEESVACTVKVDDPTVVAAPETVPLFESSVSPAGSWPATIDQLYGADPPVAESVCE